MLGPVIYPRLDVDAGASETGQRGMPFCSLEERGGSWRLTVHARLSERLADEAAGSLEYWG